MTNESSTERFLQQLITMGSPSGDLAAQAEVQRTVVRWLQAEDPTLVVSSANADQYPWTLVRTVGCGENPIVFACHTDTVPTGRHDLWTRSPLSGDIDEETIRGRGSADMKAGIAAAAQALLYASANGRAAALLLTADEEVGARGAADAAAALEGMKPGAIVIPEATGNRIVVSHPGAFWIRVTARGIAAHGSAPERGVNAAQKLFGPISEAHEGLPLRSGETWSLGTFQAGTATNIVPDVAVATIDHRLWGIADDVLNWWKTRPSIDEVDVITHLSALNSSVPDKIRERFSSQISATPVRYFTDGSVFTGAFPSTPILIWGPGAPEQMHAVDEHITRQSLRDAVRDFCSLVDL